MLLLDQWAAPLTWMFDGSPYLVGSVLTKRTYRDVDVRLGLPDDDPLILDPNRLRLFNVAMSVWAQQASGLNVDFQFQPLSEWEAQDGPRNPLGGRWRTVREVSTNGRPEDCRHPNRPGWNACEMVPECPDCGSWAP